jgi:hypothetical protein
MFTLNLVRTAWFLTLLLVQSMAYANVVGPAEVQKLFERVRSTLDHAGKRPDNCQNIQGFYVRSILVADVWVLLTPQYRAGIS